MGLSDIGFPFLGDQFDSFMHPERGYQAGEDELSKYFEMAKKYLEPYSQHGQDQYGNLSSGINSLMNPEGLMNRFISGYQTSPYAQRELEMNKGAGMDAASQMGLMDSSAALGNIQQGASDVVSKDRQSYINQMMQNYLNGLNLSNSVYGTGADAAGNLFSGTNQMGENMSKLKYGEMNSPGDMFNNLLKMGMQMMGGGGSFAG